MRLKGRKTRSEEEGRGANDEKEENNGGEGPRAEPFRDRVHELSNKQMLCKRWQAGPHSGCSNRNLIDRGDTARSPSYKMFPSRASLLVITDEALLIARAIWREPN